MCGDCRCSVFSSGFIGSQVGSFNFISCMMLFVKKLCDCWKGVSDPSFVCFAALVVVGGLALLEPKEPAGESKLPFSDVIVAVRT